jgi:hypothetical protein
MKMTVEDSLKASLKYSLDQLTEQHHQMLSQKKALLAVLD